MQAWACAGIFAGGGHIFCCFSEDKDPKKHLQNPEKAPKNIFKFRGTLTGTPMILKAGNQFSTSKNQIDQHFKINTGLPIKGSASDPYIAQTPILMGHHPLGPWSMVRQEPQRSVV
jgi:hypothetical protein